MRCRREEICTTVPVVRVSCDNDSAREPLLLETFGLEWARRNLVLRFNVAFSK